VTEYLHAGARQFGFMVRGLRLMEPKLAALNIPLFLLKGGLITLPRIANASKNVCQTGSAGL
jgi:deoxyribodipyrimidine photo-lyase